MKLSYEEHGSGHPVVLLHAFPFSRRMWDVNKDAVTGAGFRLILPDLRGFGESTSLSEINTMEDMASDVATLLDDLKIERAVIGGLSMGGYVTFELFRQIPEKFEGLILCDTTSAADTDEKREGRLETVKKVEANGNNVLIDEMLPNLFGEMTKADHPETVAFMAAITKATPPQATAAALRGMAARRDSADVLADIKVPTLLIFGEEDKVTNLEAARRLESAIDGAELHIIKNAGHLSNVEQPEQFSSLLVNFLKQFAD